MKISFILFCFISFLICVWCHTHSDYLPLGFEEVHHEGDYVYEHKSITIITSSQASFVGCNKCHYTELRVFFSFYRRNEIVLLTRTDGRTILGQYLLTQNIGLLQRRNDDEKDEAIYITMYLYNVYHINN